MSIALPDLRPIDLTRIASVAVFAFALTACGSVASGPASTASAACASWTTSDYAAARVVRRLRVYTNRATGDSAIDETAMTPRATPLMKTGKILVEYDFGSSSKTQIVYGPADLDIPLHPAPYREAFLVLQGSVVMKLGDGTERTLVAGDMTVFEDTDASRGHGGRTGPCGYVALNIVP